MYSKTCLKVMSKLHPNLIRMMKNKQRPQQIALKLVKIKKKLYVLCRENGCTPQAMAR